MQMMSNGIEKVNCIKSNVILKSHFKCSLFSFSSLPLPSLSHFLHLIILFLIFFIASSFLIAPSTEKEYVN